MTNDTMVWKDAFERVGKAKFGRHWITELNDREDYVLRVTANGPPLLSDWSKVDKKADWMAYQHSAVQKWFRMQGLPRGKDLIRTKFEYCFARGSLPFGGGMAVDGYHSTEAFERVGEAMFEADWISNLTEAELYIHERGSSEPGEYVAVDLKAREMNHQHDQVLQWLDDNQFMDETAGEDVGAEFERALAENFATYDAFGRDRVSKAEQERIRREASATVGQPGKSNRKPKAAPRRSAVERALIAGRFHVDQKDKTHKEITRQIERDIGTDFGASPEARVKAVSRALERLRKNERG